MNQSKNLTRPIEDIAYKPEISVEIDEKVISEVENNVSFNAKVDEKIDNSIRSGTLIDEETIPFSKLTQAAQDMVRTGGLITNNPDDEDLEIVASVLKFKDRTAFGNQKGCKIIRADFDFANIPTNYENSRWIIQYEHDLSTNTIVIPSGVELVNNGGFFKNGIIQGNGTIIDSGLSHFFDSDLTLAGSWSFKEVFPEWFGAIGDDVADDTASFLNMIDSMNSAASRYNRTALLSENKTYLLSASLPIMNNLSFIARSKAGAATLKNVTTDMFHVPIGNVIDNRIWAYVFKNVRFVGNDTNFLTADTYQHWTPEIASCNFSGFANIFEGVRLYASKLRDLNGGNLLSIGSIGGSDNVFDGWIITGRDGDVDILLNITGLFLSRFSNIFFTGGLSSGCNQIVYGTGVKDVTFSKCWFDYADGEAVFVENSSFIDIDNNTYRGCVRSSTSGIVTIKACKGVNGQHNKFLNNHVGVQNMTAKSWRIFDFAGNILENIYVKNNQYEIPFFNTLSLINGVFTNNIVIDEPSQNFYFDTIIDLLPKYNLPLTAINGITPNQSNDGSIFLNGTASANASIYLVGGFGLTDTLLSVTLGSEILIKISELSTDVKLILVSNTTIIGIFNHDEVWTVSSDTDVTGIGLYVPGGVSLSWEKTIPSMILRTL